MSNCSGEDCACTNPDRVKELMEDSVPLEIWEKEAQKGKRPAKLHYKACDKFFKPCPFCGNGVIVEEVPETRYGEGNHFGWSIECKNMGCIFSYKGADQSLLHLMELWNKRN